MLTLRSGLWFLITLAAHVPKMPTKYDQFGLSIGFTGVGLGRMGPTGPGRPKCGF